jgi:hypothetical protein
MTMVQNDPPNPFTADIDTSFPKGDAFADWLVNVQASMMKGRLQLSQAKHSVNSVDPKLARRWIYSDNIPTSPLGNPSPTGVQYLTFNTPVGAAAGMECGRTVFTDIHVSGMEAAGPALAHGVPDGRPDAAGEGPRVHAVRPLLLHPAGLREAQAALYPLAEPPRGSPRPSRHGRLSGRGVFGCLYTPRPGCGKI